MTSRDVCIEGAFHLVGSQEGDEVCDLLRCAQPPHLLPLDHVPDGLVRVRLLIDPVPGEKE